MAKKKLIWKHPKKKRSYLGSYERSGPKRRYFLLTPVLADVQTHEFDSPQAAKKLGWTSEQVG